MDDLPIESPQVNAIQDFVLLEKQKRTATTVPTHCYRYSVIVIHWGLWSRAGPGELVGGFCTPLRGSLLTLLKSSGGNRIAAGLNWPIEVRKQS